MITLISGSSSILSAESSAFSTNSLTVVYKHFPGCSAGVSIFVLTDKDLFQNFGLTVDLCFLQQIMRKKVFQDIYPEPFTLSNPAIFLFSAKNSAGLFCSSTSALRPFVIGLLLPYV